MHEICPTSDRYFKLWGILQYLLHWKKLFLQYEGTLGNGMAKYRRLLILFCFHYSIYCAKTFSKGNFIAQRNNQGNRLWFCHSLSKSKKCHSTIQPITNSNRLFTLVTSAARLAHGPITCTGANLGILMWWGCKYNCARSEQKIFATTPIFNHKHPWHRVQKCSQEYPMSML